MKSFEVCQALVIKVHPQEKETMTTQHKHPSISRGILIQLVHLTKEIVPGQTTQRPFSQ